MKRPHQRQRGISRLALTCLGASIGLIPLAYGQAFNLSGDFSTSQNPNGVWSYNQGGAPLLPATANYGLVGWGGVPYIGKAVGSAPSGWYDVQPGDVVIHVATQGNPDASITWTSPAAGMIDISGFAWDSYFYPGRDSSWSVTVNGIQVAAHSSVYALLRSEPAASFANNIVSGQQLNGISVTPGEVVEFTTHATTTYGHFMGVDMTVNFTAVPEPTSCAIAGLGLLTFAVGRRLVRRSPLTQCQ